jgi:DNA-binding transcriptional LysR family regulator
VSKLPDFEGLAIFAKVVQTRSFMGATAELRLSKATVSKAVSRIEKRFGTRLFNRTARRLAVTEAGRQLYDRAAHILTEGEAAERLRRGNNASSTHSFLAIARFQSKTNITSEIGL